MTSPPFLWVQTHTHTQTSSVPHTLHTGLTPTFTPSHPHTSSLTCLLWDGGRALRVRRTSHLIPAQGPTAPGAKGPPLWRDPPGVPEPWSATSFQLQFPQNSRVPFGFESKKTKTSASQALFKPRAEVKAVTQGHSRASCEVRKGSLEVCRPAGKSGAVQC